MVPQRCLLRLNVVGATPDRSYVPLVSPAASAVPAVRTSPRCRSNVPPPLSSFQKPLWRRKRPSGMNISHLCAMTQMSLRDLSTSTKDFQYEAAASPPTPEGGRRLFDTHAVVRLFEENGFSAQQAEAMVKILVRMTQANMDVIYGDMATKVHQELMFQRVMSQITAVKKDMVILEKSEFSALLAENEKLKIQILKLKVQLADMMTKVRSDTLLDMNLEKSHVKELKAEHEKKLLERRTELMEMSAEHDYHLTQTKMKIDTEVAGLKTMLESHKLDTIKYLAGSVFTCLTVILGFYRIWM